MSCSRSFSKFICCLVASWSLFLPGSHTVAASNESDVLRIGTMDLAPYGWEESNGEKRGIIYELNEEIGRRSGLPYTHEIYPFRRMLMMLKNGELDLLSSQAHAESLAAGDKLAVQFRINVIAGTKKGSRIKGY